MLSLNRPGLCGPFLQPTFNILFTPHKNPKIGNQLFLFCGSGKQGKKRKFVRALCSLQPEGSSQWDFCFMSATQWGRKTSLLGGQVTC